MAGASGRCCEHWCAARVRHGGATLVYVLCLLVIILLLGISAAQMALQGEKAARGERDRQIAVTLKARRELNAQREAEEDDKPNCKTGFPGRMAAGIQKRGKNWCCHESVLVEIRSYLSRIFLRNRRRGLSEAIELSA